MTHRFSFLSGYPPIICSRSIRWIGGLLLVYSCVSCATAIPSSPSEKKPWSAGLLKFYQDVISPIDGDRCPMVPTCSAYTYEAIEKHGWFMGWIMGCDRLIRCGGDELDVSEITVRGVERHCLDPVSANDTWWGK